jgi:L-ascorbate metabolism protein UlaG (beta-lactamase superfamily)
MASWQHCSICSGKQVPWERLEVVHLNTPRVIEGVCVTFLDANHCPGAAMILFEAPGRPPVLHTGDCRCGRINPLRLLNTFELGRWSGWLVNRHNYPLVILLCMAEASLKHSKDHS